MEQSSRWRAFRKAALATPYYREHPISRDGVTELGEFYSHHAAFLNPGADIIPEAGRLETVWEPLPRTKAVNPWFRLQPPVEVVLDPRSLIGKACEVLAAPAAVLASLAAARPAVPPPAYGVIAFTGISQLPLTQPLRDLLWAAWRTPIFEQFRGFQGEPLAFECEAFAGLHYDPDVVVWEERTGQSRELLVTSLVNLRHPAWRLATGRRGRVDHAACDCGSVLPRIVWEGE